ncbi:MAG TPA: Hsp70 family protein [Pirellulales bacterium]|nr:Hsp70 family protein [Pirellulales bacterium]
MSVDLRLLLEKHGSDFLDAALQGLVGQSSDVVRDDAQYKVRVEDESWRAAPMQIRMLDPAEVGWDDFCRALREPVFDLTGGVVALRPDWKAGVAAVLRDWALPPTDASSTPAAPSDSASAQLLALSGGQRAVGIDLGTTYSVIAYVDAQGRPTTITNSSGDALTPSVVLFDEGATVVGKEAVLAAALEPDKVAECVKRDMGEKYYSRRIKGELLPPEVISSYILRRLKADAERKLGPVSKAVITVPAYFDETRRRATMDAGRLAGLEVLDIINEPTAAAIVYGYQEGFLDRSGAVTGDQQVRVLVYDLGGGTFDVTVVEMRGKSFKAVATDGDVRLGGKDWDEKIIEIAAAKLQNEIGEDPRQCPETLEDMWLAAETTKRALTERLKATMFLNHRGRRLKTEITRAEFEEATAPLVLRTHTTAEIVVMQAGLTWQDIDRVLVVGGSSRMPMIVRMLEELAGQAVNHSVSADEAVAHGAALYADMLMHERGAGTGHAQFSVANINSHSLGVVGIDPSTGDRLNKIIIPKNTPLPHSAARRFKTFKSGQPNVKVTVVEGDSELPDACIEVGTCVIHDLPPNLPAGWPVEVRYTYQENGRLQVAAKLIGHEGMVATEFVRNNSLSEDDLMLWGQCLNAEATKNRE